MINLCSLSMLCRADDKQYSVCINLSEASHFLTMQTVEDQTEFSVMSSLLAVIFPQCSWLEKDHAYIRLVIDFAGTWEGMLCIVTNNAMAEVMVVQMLLGVGDTRRTTACQFMNVLDLWTLPLGGEGPSQNKKPKLQKKRRHHHDPNRFFSPPQKWS